MANQKEQTVSVVKWIPVVLDALRELENSGKPKEVENFIIKKCKLDEIYLEKTHKSGVSKFSNEVAWARQYLVWEGLISNSKRGVWNLTKEGVKSHLTEKQAYEIYNKWATKNHEKIKRKKEIETFDSRFLEELKNVSNTGFESICLELLREYGFENLKETSHSKDGGIDGYGSLVINGFSKMKIDAIFQCKRYTKDAVAIKSVRSFVGVMHIRQFSHGIFLTTSRFTQETEKEMTESNVMLELIDGGKLVQMFKEVELGMIEIKDSEMTDNEDKLYRIDENYFNRFK